MTIGLGSGVWKLRLTKVIIGGHDGKKSILVDGTQRPDSNGSHVVYILYNVNKFTLMEKAIFGNIRGIMTGMMPLVFLKVGDCWGLLLAVQLWMDTWMDGCNGASMEDSTVL